MRISKLPNDDHSCGWYESLPPPEPARRLEGDQNADWVVLGAGFAGLAAARQLATLQPQARVVLIEAQRVGYGASGRNSGFIIDLPHNIDSADIENIELNQRVMRLNHAAIAYIQEIVQTHGIACDWGKRGKFQAAVGDRGMLFLEAFKRGLDALGVNYELRETEALARTLGMTYYRAAVYTPDCILMQPAALVRGLAATLPENVDLLEESPVEAVHYGSQIRLECPEGKVVTKNLVLATNAFTESFGFLKGRLIPVLAFASLTRPLRDDEQTALGGEADWGLTPADHMGTTLRRTRDNRILVRNTFRFTADLSSTEGERRRMRENHEVALRARFPMLPDVNFEYTWGGIVCFSRNFAPFFGRLAANVFAAVCQNAVGAAKGTISGKLVADLAVGADSELLSDMQAFPHPIRNPPRPLLAMGVTMKINWDQWRAGTER